MADFVFDGFRLAEKYRLPVMILADGALGQMMEKVQMPEGGSLAHETPAWATTGKTPNRERNIITSLFIQPEKMEEVNLRLQKKYARIQRQESRCELIQVEDADIVLVAFGLSARIAQKALELARAKGLRVGLIRPITLFPFPSEILAEQSLLVDAFLTVEMNAGQMVEDVKLAVEGKRPVFFKGRMGGMIPTPEDVLASIESIAEEHVATFAERM
jgi:2-oxoglutarate ferredoxin oxidoreductase subunit alpha